MTLQCRVPSWNFCNYDGQTADNRFSKELCRFCKSTKQGHYCLLHEKWLMADNTFVHKTSDCIEATAGYAITVDEPVPTSGPTIQPKVIIKETLKSYKKAVNELVAQGLPRNMAETLAEKHILED